MPLKHTPVPLAIIGGGAAGLFAASIAAQRGLGCLVFERKARPGSKLLMTANGRCNFTKNISAEDFLKDLGEPVASFAAAAVRACPPAQIMRGFKGLGIELRQMTDGRVFPASGDAATIAHAFGDLLRDNEVPIVTNCAVTGIQPMKNGFIVGTKNFTVWAENVLVTTGGISFPKTGSVGDGQNFAYQMGLKLVPYKPGLVGFETREPKIVRAAGQVFENSFARILEAGSHRPLIEVRGEVDCETWGVGGAAVYNCSRYLARHPQGKGWILEVGLGKEVVTLDSPVPCSTKEAIVTMGGVSLDEVFPDTMMAKKIPGLYFAGEVLDIDGPTGGYNLTLAFATARLAVSSILAAHAPRS